MDLSKDWYRSEFVSHEALERHREIESELDFYSAIADGNMELVEKNCKSKAFINPEGMGKLSENSLQNIRYHFVVTVALITRYCVHAGLEQEKAYGMSDFYILKMDKLRKIEDISDLHDTMCKDFCRHMTEKRKSHVLSKQIVLCLDYIYKHIHYRITINEVAKYLEISESYLSRLFKKEMGLPFSKYISELKIDKAKNLLRFSDYSISDISYYLGFSNESHFIQTFHKMVNETPSNYRKKFFRSEWELKLK